MLFDTVINWNIFTVHSVYSQIQVTGWGVWGQKLPINNSKLQPGFCCLSSHLNSFSFYIFPKKLNSVFFFFFTSYLFIFYFFEIYFAKQFLFKSFEHESFADSNQLHVKLQLAIFQSDQGPTINRWGVVLFSLGIDYF